MTSEHQPKTPNELLKSLKLKRDKIDEKMKAFPLDTDQTGFAKLYSRALELDKQIKNVTDLIKPVVPSGEIGQFTLRSIQNTEGRRIIRKKK
jgi:hypothetical protein